MPDRLKYHFEPKNGWMNDPNGLVFFRGKYHAFFQHYPYAPKWGQMHWGHAVSADLIHWEELPIALFPDKPYENAGGCYSGSAVVKDDLLYLFYTSVSKELGQTQSVAISSDGVNFTKYSDNPVIKKNPVDSNKDFRDPKVTKIGDIYYMVCGSGKNHVGKILLFSSQNLLEWDYSGVLFSSKKHGSVLECPDFFPFNDKYLLVFSQMGKKTHSTVFIYGDFDKRKFTPISFHSPEAGPHFYAPQTFLDNNNRRIIIGWLYSWDKKLDKGAHYAGALSIPREIKIVNGKICTFPVYEANHLIKKDDEFVNIKKNSLSIKGKSKLKYKGTINDVNILRDTKTVEVFINSGEASFSYWFAK